MSAPVGLAALTLRVPLVLSEADSHLGLSNRLLARFARRVCLAFPIPGRDEPALPRHRPPGPGRRRLAATARRAAALRRPRRGPLRARVRRLARGALDQPRGGGGVRRGRPSTCSTSAAAATTPSWPGARLPDTYHLLEYLDLRAVRRSARRRRSGGRARRRVGVRARRPRAAGDPRPVPPRRGRPPERQRPLDGAGGGGGDRRRRASSTAAGLSRTVGELLADERRLAAMAARRPLAGPPRRRPGGGRRAAGGGRRDERRREGRGCAALGGRRIHLVGVGGAGMSAYARAAHALGASVSGSDADEGPYLEAPARRRGARRARRPRGREPARRATAWSVYYSSAVPPENPERAARARAGDPGAAPRAGCWASCRALRRTIAVAGTHGKTTTAAMLVHALRGGGPGPGLADRRHDRRRTCRTAHWSEGDWLVVEADESDRSLLELKVELGAADERRARPPRRASARCTELREVFRRFLAGRRAGGGVGPARAAGAARRRRARRLRRARGGARPGRLALPLARARRRTCAVPGAHNALDAAGALEAGAPRRRRGAAARSRRWPASPAPGGAFSGSARARRARSCTTTTPTTRARSRPRCRRARTLEHRRLVAVFQPHLYSRTRALAREFGRALAAADVVAVLDVYPARERAEDFPGVSGLLVAEAAADAAAGQARLLAARPATRRSACSRAAARGRRVRGDGRRRHRRLARAAGGPDEPRRRWSCAARPSARAA